MAKTSAQRSKEYRQRKKGDALFKEKERNRKKEQRDFENAMGDLAEKRRAMARERQRRRRKRIKEQSDGTETNALGEHLTGNAMEDPASRLRIQKRALVQKLAIALDSTRIKRMSRTTRSNSSPHLKAKNERCTFHHTYIYNQVYLSAFTTENNPLVIPKFPLGSLM